MYIIYIIYLKLYFFIFKLYILELYLLELYILELYLYLNNLFNKFIAILVDYNL